MPSRMTTTSLALLHHALGPLDDELGDEGVLLGGPVEGGRDHLAADGPPHVGDLLGPLVDEQHEEVDLGVVALDRPGDLLHDRGLARLGRRDDQAPLALADGRDEVDDPRRHVVGLLGALEAQPLVGEQRGEVLEAGAGLGLVGGHAVDRVDAQQRRVLLVAAGGPALAGDEVAAAQRELADLLHRDVDVVLAREVAAQADEAVALVAQVEKPLDVDGLALDRLVLALPPVTAAAPPAAVPRLGLLAVLALVAATGPGPLLGGLGRLLGGGRGRLLVAALLAVGALGGCLGGPRRRAAARPGVAAAAPRAAGPAAATARRVVVGRRLVAVGRRGLLAALGGRLGLGGGLGPGLGRVPRGHPGELEDHVDDRGLPGPRPGLAPERGGDRHQLVAVLALERRALELLGFGAHPRTSFRRGGVWSRAGRGRR